ncbi:MAG: efflux RND transporter periplasmic adaptor subunit [Bacteroidales bacterium]|nr:efflux RND transporter periplasmic adaptor subunit [Bacteroidales bacterium]MDZ4204827.1 efflux RND transporter periplasmic adaptor subunit [Bacteroidales bacterium]
MNRNLKRIILFSLVALVLLFLLGRRLGWFELKTTDVAPVSNAPSILPVNAMVVQLIELDNKILATGTILPDESVELSSEASGKITSLMFKEGSRVRKGDLLLTINDADLQAQIQRLRYQETMLTEREYRQRMLLEKEAVSREVYDKALTDLNTNRAEIRSLEALIAKTRVVAPFDGVIGLRHVSEGSYITPNIRIASLTRMQPVKIEFTIPERYATEVGAGNRITFNTGDRNQVYEAKVYAVEPVIDQTTRTLKLRALFPNSRMEVMPGSFANIELILNTYHNTVNIPTEAVIPEMGALKVFLYKSGICQPVVVKAGIRSSDKIQITEGLNEGDTIITTGLLQLRKGMAVEVISLL